jgi:hypothetical protein
MICYRKLTLALCVAAYFWRTYTEPVNSVLYFGNNEIS